VHAQLVEQLARIGQHVHEVRHRRALVAADVGDAGLQQRLGDGEDALAGEGLAGAKPQLGDFRLEGSFHSLCWWAGYPGSALVINSIQAIARRLFCIEPLHAGTLRGLGQIVVQRRQRQSFRAGPVQDTTHRTLTA
jgi:hypothetical protein